MAAVTWMKVQLLALAFLAVAILSLMALSVFPWVLWLLPAAIAFYAVAIGGYRSAVTRERAAGYTTIFGDDADVVLPGKGASPRIRMFPTRDLWQLNPRTGEVVRRPGDPPDTRNNKARSG